MWACACACAPRASKGTKEWPSHLICAQCSLINAALSLETNIGPSYLWTCSSTSLIQVDFFFPFPVSLSLPPSPTRHLSCHTCMCQQKLSLTATHCASTGSLGFGGNEKKREKVVRMNICITMSASGLSRCQPFKRRLGEDLWIIKGPRLMDAPGSCQVWF